MKEIKAPVSQRALIQRLNRKLEKEGLTVKKTSGKRAKVDLGEFFLLDLKRNSAVKLHVDLQKLGHEHGVLAEWERMEG
jgi:hypothetical protein